MRIASLMAFVVLCGCMHVETKRTIRGKDGKDLGTVAVNGATDGEGAALVLSAVERYEGVLAGGSIADKAVERGLPVSLSTAGAQVSVGGLYTVGYGAFANTEAYAPLVAAQASTFGYSPYRRAPPPQQRGPAPPQHVAPPQGAAPQPQGLPVLSGNREACPSSQAPVTDGQRITCLEEARRRLVRKVFDGK